MLEQLEKTIAVGGLGCESCMYWQEYGPMTLELYSLVGRWGRCSNLKATHDINNKYLRQTTSTNDRIMTNINRLGIDTQILSTCPTYSCSSMRIPTTTKPTPDISTESESPD
jgi:hypothetical protein